MALSDSCDFEQLRETVADGLDIFPNPDALSAGDSVMIMSVYHRGCDIFETT